MHALLGGEPVSTTSGDEYTKQPFVVIMFRSGWHAVHLRVPVENANATHYLGISIRIKDRTSILL
jgi:hypothetical protein